MAIGGPRGYGRRRSGYYFERPDFGYLGQMGKKDKDKQIRSAWDNYQMWTTDIELGKERSISTTRARMAMQGQSLEGDAFQTAISEIEKEAEERLKEIEEGPTMAMLSDYWSGREAKAFNTGAWAEAEKEVRANLLAEYETEWEEQGQEVQPGPRGTTGKFAGTQTRKGPRGRVTVKEFQDPTGTAEFEKLVYQRQEELFEGIGADTGRMKSFYEKTFGEFSPTGLSAKEKAKKKAQSASGNLLVGDSVDQTNPWLT